VDELELARWTFALTTIFHFIFVPASIGLAFVVAWCQTRHYRTGDPAYLRMTQFWAKFMLISFALGVVTGIWQEFQFGMNWSAYSRYVGDVFGAPLAIEGLAAFFLESTFIGLWLFGRGRMRPGLHLATIWLVAIGTVLSATFIIAANSWMQRPAGSEVVNGKAELVDIGAVLTNPLFIFALPHTVFAALLTGSMIVVAVSAWQLRRSNEVELFTRSMRMALPVVLVTTLVVFLSGDEFARRLIEWQPMKMAAAEALFETEQPASLSLFATGDFEGNPGETNRNIKIPHLLSLIATLSWDGEVRGINDIQAEYEQRYGPGDYAPIVGVAYWSFRTMITCALALIALSAVGLWFARKGRLHASRRYLWLAVAAVVLPFLGNTAGWLLAEMGRQPWVVQGLMLTRDGISPNVSTAETVTALAVLVGVYSVLGAVGGWLVLRELRHGPPPAVAAEEPPDGQHPDLSLAY
jgi:cytochrome d ubiquinol oxidase subunit I